MSSGTFDHDLNGYEITILAKVREQGEVVGKFNLVFRVLELRNPYWAHLCIQRLERRGLIHIERRPPPAPLIIRSVT